MTNDQTVVTDEMVTRFLSYKIPAYIEYTNGGNYSTSEARQMLEHVLGGEVAPQPMPVKAVEAMQQAINALEQSKTHNDGLNFRDHKNEVIKNLNAALASQTEPREIINSNPEIPDNSIDKAAEQAVAVEQKNREAAYESLLKAASGQLRAWHQKYGNHAPSWLPPGGDVSLLETIDDWLDTNTTSTQPEPTLNATP